MYIITLCLRKFINGSPLQLGSLHSVLSENWKETWKGKKTETELKQQIQIKYI